MSLTKAEILGVKDVEIEKVQVPEWGGDGHVFIKSLSSLAVSQYQASVNDGTNRNLRNMFARLVVLCLCDEKGNEIFAPSEAEKLGERRHDVLLRLFNACTKLNNMTEADLEELKGNSGDSLSSDSPSS